jgi:probable HAF family extracellular repeat protein
MGCRGSEVQILSPRPLTSPVYAITDLGTLGGSESYALGINNSGLVVGNSNPAGDPNYHATLWSGSAATDLGTLGGTYGVGYAINSARQIAGTSMMLDTEIGAESVLDTLGRIEHGVFA